ncbi:MAG: glycosyltransferase family 4 protein [Longimicrobiales bacterium]|nr:glycosyltransferase family 4 protein [Longimicrobiales bacterium]
MRAPRLLVVAGGLRTTASTRHRLWNYRPFLEADGADLTWIEYGGGRESSFLRALALRVGFVRDLLRTASHQDVVWVQKVLPPAYFFHRWKASGARVVYDFDDALFARAVTGESETTWRKRKARFDLALASADVVVAGSPPLGDYARGRGAQVEVMYPSLERSRFPDRTRAPRPAGGEVVGWVGNDQSQIYLRALEPVLVDVLRDRPGVRLAVCSSVRPALCPELLERLDFIPWSEDAELTAASGFDLAVSPLGHEAWSRARGGRVSVLLSMAAGAPLVASPGGGLTELAGEDGGVLFADNPETWRRNLVRLLDDAGERERLGRQARAVVDRGIWADVQYPRLKEVLFGA